MSNMYICGIRESDIGAKNKSQQACLKIPYRGFEISISFDNGCGASVNLFRSDCRIYYGDNFENDITDNVLGGSAYSLDAGDLKGVFSKIDTAIANGLYPDKE